MDDKIVVLEVEWQTTCPNCKRRWRQRFRLDRLLDVADQCGQCLWVLDKSVLGELIPKLATFHEAIVMEKKLLAKE